MYLVGKVKKVIDGQTVAWDVVAVTRTRKGAVKACEDVEHFFMKVGFGPVGPDVQTIFPKRYR
jgi:hypothetical protein